MSIQGLGMGEDLSWNYTFLWPWMHWWVMCVMIHGCLPCLSLCCYRDTSQDHFYSFCLCSLIYVFSESTALKLHKTTEIMGVICVWELDCGHSGLTGTALYWCSAIDFLMWSVNDHQLDRSTIIKTDSISKLWKGGYKESTYMLNCRK